MTDEAFVLKEEIRDKKRTSYSANKKPVRNSRRVRMPSDYLTQKEKEMMTGEIKTYNLKKPMKWAEFKALPDDLKKEYLIRLKKLYRANDTCLGEMMGVSKTSVGKERIRLGIDGSARGEQPFPEWQSFLKYGTPIDAPREATPLKELISPEVKAKLAEYEQHPPAIIAKTDSDTPIDTPIGASEPDSTCNCEEHSAAAIRPSNIQYLSPSSLRALSYCHGILAVCSAAAENHTIAEHLNTCSRYLDLVLNEVEVCV